LSERLRRWSNKPDAVGLIPVTTDFFLISCDSNQVTKWFGTHYNQEVQWCYSAEVGVWCRTGYSSMGLLCGLRQGQNASLTLNYNNNPIGSQLHPTIFKCYYASSYALIPACSVGKTSTRCRHTMTIKKKLRQDRDFRLVLVLRIFMSKCDCFCQGAI